MNKETPFRRLQDNQSHQSYYFQKKTYASGENLSETDNQQERILFLTDSPDVLYVPAFAAGFAFDAETAVFDLSLPKTKQTLPTTNDSASPFYLTGDACFYHFMARKIKVTETMDFYHKKGNDFLWLLSGRVALEADGHREDMQKNQLILVEKQDFSYQITGNGEIFLVKL